jgi:hypothetical protein
MRREIAKEHVAGPVRNCSRDNSFRLIVLSRVQVSFASLIKVVFQEVFETTKVQLTTMLIQYSTIGMLILSEISGSFTP